MTEPKWKEFENAVAKFVAALDCNAKVTPNVRLPDVHTSKPRQRDVWVEAKVCNHFPIKVLISCKRLSKKINQQDIDAFYGEWGSSGAHLGVLYSYSGFTLNAIEKAKVLGINCCRLFVNEPPDIPGSLVFVESFCVTPRLSISVGSPLNPQWNLKIWNDLFSLQFEDEGLPMLVIDAIVRSYFRGEEEAIRRAKETFFPSNWNSTLECIEEKPVKKIIKIILRGSWNVYEGRLDAHFLNGSYNFSSGEYLGSLGTPAVDTQSSHPGPGWILLDTPPSKAKTKGIKSLCIKPGGNVKKTLIDKLGPKEITVE